MLLGQWNAKLPSPIIVYTSSHVNFPSQKKPLNDNVFHLSDSFSLCFIMCSAGNAESSNLFFGSLFIKYAVLLFLNSLFDPPYAFFVFDSIFWTWQQCFSASMRILYFYHLCFQLFFEFMFMFSSSSSSKLKKSSKRREWMCLWIFCWIIESNSRGMWHEMWVIILQHYTPIIRHRIDKNKKPGSSMSILNWKKSTSLIDNATETITSYSLLSAPSN